MKTIVSIILFLSVSLSGLAEDGAGLEKELKRVMSYPVKLAGGNKQLVAVAIKVDESGKLHVTGINASSQELATYVRGRIENLILPQNDPRIGQEFFYKVTFKQS